MYENPQKVMNMPISCRNDRSLDNCFIMWDDQWDPSKEGKILKFKGNNQRFLMWKVCLSIVYYEYFPEILQW